MNAGRLYAASEAIKNELADQKIIDHLNQFKTVLQQSVNQPTPDNAKLFKEKYFQVIKILSECSSNNAPPTRRKIFDEIKASPKIGNGLLSRITKILEENQVTPADALSEINKVVSEITQFQQTINVVTQNFEALGIEYDELEPGKFEIGISIPKEIIKSNLEGLEKEIRQLDRAFKTFKEIAGDESTSIKIKTLSSSEVQAFLLSTAEVATCVAIAIERIVALYRNHLEIKKIKLDLEKYNVPSDNTKGLDEYIKNSVETKLHEIGHSIVNEYYKTADEGRKNELTTALTLSLKYLAERIDNGACFEVNAANPEEPQAKDEAEKSSPEYTQAVANYKEIKEMVDSVNKKGRSISSLQKSDKPILKLSSGEDDNQKQK